MSNVADRLRAIRMGLSKQDESAPFIEIEVQWLSQVKPDFDVNALPPSLVRGIYADVLEYGPHRERIMSFLNYVKSSFGTCVEDDVPVAEIISKWFNNCRFSRSQPLGRFMDDFLPLRINDKYRQLAHLGRPHTQKCSYVHSFARDPGEMVEGLWALILIIALDGALPANSKEERERQYWLKRIPPALLTHMK